MNYYKVTFKWYDTDTWCCNLAIAKNVYKVRDHYIKYSGEYENIFVEQASPSFVRASKKRGMPIVTID